MSSPNFTSLADDYASFDRPLAHLMEMFSPNATVTEKDRLAYEAYQAGKGKKKDESRKKKDESRKKKGAKEEAKKKEQERNQVAQGPADKTTKNNTSSKKHQLKKIKRFVLQFTKRVTETLTVVTVALQFMARPRRVERTKPKASPPGPISRPRTRPPTSRRRLYRRRR